MWYRHYIILCFVTECTQWVLANHKNQWKIWAVWYLSCSGMTLTCLFCNVFFFFLRKSGSKFPNDMNDQIEIIPWKLPHKFPAQTGNSGQRAAFGKYHLYILPSVQMLFEWRAIVRGINYFFDPGCVVVEITIIRDTSPPPKQILSGHVGVVWNYSGQCFIHVVTDSFCVAWPRCWSNQIYSVLFPRMFTDYWLLMLNALFSLQYLLQCQMKI